MNILLGTTHGGFEGLVSSLSHGWRGSGVVHDMVGVAQECNLCFGPPIRLVRLQRCGNPAVTEYAENFLSLLAHNDSSLQVAISSARDYEQWAATIDILEQEALHAHWTDTRLCP